MTRKDTILIAVVVNAGLLAILFATAIIYDTNQGNEQGEFVTPLVEGKNSQAEASSSLIASLSTGDEVDNVLKYYSQPPSRALAVDPSVEEIYIPEPLAVHSNTSDEEEFIQDQLFVEDHPFVEITVKKGDVLEKIARAHKTTVAAIKRTNHLTHERLSIGQVLKIPLKKEKENASPFVSPAVVHTPKEPVKEQPVEAVYYVIKSGDNPWKIAKQYNVKAEDIVRLNHLNEESARNLKVGDQIRVK